MSRGMAPVSGRAVSRRPGAHIAPRAPLNTPSTPAEPAALMETQRLIGNTAFGGVIAALHAQRDAAAPAARQDAGDVRAVAEKVMVDAVALFGVVDENKATDEVFWLEHPDQRGIKLQPGTPAASEWLRLRDNVVHPTLRDIRAQLAATARASAPKPTEAPPAPSSTETSNPHTDEKHPATRAGRGDKFVTQGASTYTDSGVPKGWKAVGATCNVTSLSMALISLTGDEDTLRQKVAAVLQTKGVHEGAACEVQGRGMMWIAEVIKDPKLVARARLQDLIAAAVIGPDGNVGKLLKHDLLMQIAKATGMANAKSQGMASLADEKARQDAKKLLDQGARVIATTGSGSHGHIVYLVEVLDTGVVIHDPDGIRVSNVKPPWFLDSVAGGWGRWLAALSTEEHREIALRRVETNDQVRPLVERLVEVAKLPETDPERKRLLAQLKKDFPSFMPMGANNFYNLDDLEKFEARLAFSLTARGG